MTVNPKSQSYVKRSMIVNKKPSFMLNSNVKTIANPYLDKLSLRNKVLGK